MSAVQNQDFTDEETISVEEQQIRELVFDALYAWNQHDARAFVHVYAEDADLTTVNGMTVHGRRAIGVHYEQIFETIFKRSHLTAGEIEIRFLSPEIAAVGIRWEMTGALEWDGKVIPVRKGLLNWIVTRHAAGWLVTVMHNQEFTSLRY